MALNAAISPDEYEAAVFFVVFFLKNLDLELKFVKTKTKKIYVHIFCLFC